MWLSDLQLVLPDRTLDHGSIHIEGQRIAEIVEGPAPAQTSELVVQGSGLIAMPAIIDMHGDMIEGETEPRPGAHFPLDMAILELDKRLAASGIATAYAAISFWENVRREQQRSADRSLKLVQAIHALRDSLLIDLYVHARYEVATPAVASTLAELLDARQIHLLSLMDHTPGQGQYRDLEQYVAFMSSWLKQHPDEIEAQTRERIRRVQEGPSVWAQAADIVALALAQGMPIASHDDDTPAKVDLMTTLHVTISEFPVTLGAAQAAKQRGLVVAMGAPNVLRGLSHTGNLSALEAIEAGVVDILAADYSPASLLQAAFVIADRGVLPVHEAVKLISQNVAAAVGLHDRGRLATDLSGDITLVEVSGRPRVRATLRQGRPIYWDGEMARRTPGM